MSVSTPEISAYLDKVLSGDSSAKAMAMAIRAQVRQPWPDALTKNGRRFELRWCESELAIRESLFDIEQADPTTTGLVVITPLSTHEVADDIASRLARGQIYQPEAWNSLRQFFNAKEIDARLGKYKWMPQLLIDGAAQGPYDPVANGFLDLETAWRAVLKRFLQLDSARPDGVALLQWSYEVAVDASLNLLPPTTRKDVMGWLSESAGAAGKLVLSCIEAGRTGDALPLGLVCGVVFSPEGEGQAVLGQAAIRLERYVGDQHVGLAEGSAWSSAAQQVVRSARHDDMHLVLERADALLKDLRITEFAHLSDLLASGLDQRMRSFAEALTVHVAAPTEPHLAQVERTADRALDHALAALQPQRRDSIEMARRLSRWLMCPVASTPTVPQILSWQSDEGAFVDWARFRLLGGDELPELSIAYGNLRSAVIARRNGIAQRCAQNLQQWNTHPGTVDARIVPVEAVLDQVLAPLAAQHPVLLLVMDGLSTSIFRELFARIASLGWTELVRSDVGHPLVGVAALPTVTEVSRTSLLCGRLTLGAAAQERTGFATHPALLARCRADTPPRLFHKGDLADATNLSQEVRAAIANPAQTVVGVVYNAVDDHLSGPDQLHQRWALEDLRLLLPLLREAREARRLVLITADHGHLLEDGTQQLPGGDSDRWRPGTGATAPHEIALSGGRVVTAEGPKAVMCLWGESTRYAGRKNGYHGGVAPQELTVPLSVIAPINMTVTGWQPAAPVQPDWWDLPYQVTKPAAVEAVSTRPAARPPGRRQAPAPVEQTQLFKPAQVPIEPLVDAQAPAVETDWIAAVLASSIYASQRQLAARVALPDDKMRVLLGSLAERGGKLSRAALAQRLALPEVRLGGLLSAVRRMLNVDQSPVLVVDESAGTIELNHALLLQQFGVRPQTGSGAPRRSAPPVGMTS